MGCGPKNTAGAEQRALEAERQARVETGRKAIDTAFAGYDDDFYNNRAKEFEDFAVPQLGQEYQNTKKNLKYSLARAGLLGSGTEVSKTGALEQENTKQLRNIADTGAAQANDLRRTVEGQRAALYSQNEAAADPGAATNLALRTAQAYERPTTFAPVTNFFKDYATAYLTNQEARQYNPNLGNMFGWGGQSQRLVNA